MSNGGSNPAPIQDEPILFAMVDVSKWLGPDVVAQLNASQKWDEFTKILPQVLRILKQLQAKFEASWSSEAIVRAAALLTIYYLDLGLTESPDVATVTTNLETICGFLYDNV
ncbi:MAG: hypothetical protein GF320_10690 [Armatimonadia bacterium]|nr:hypothetical protein [Armatimonadia bacterium]